MASTYTTGFGIEKIGSGEQSGAWGTTTNHNLDILDRIASYKAVALSGTTHTLTVREASPGSGTENLQDGMYRVIKFTGALGANNTVTIAPNTAPAYFIFENATTDSGSSGPYSVILTQGSGANITIQNGKNAIVYCDGAGSGAAVVNALSDLQIATLEVTGVAALDGAVTVGGALDVDGITNLDAVDIDGAVQIDATVSVGVDATGYDVKFFGDTTGKYALWDQSADSWIISGTQSTVTAGTSNYIAGVNAGNSIASGGNYNVTIGDNAGTGITTGDTNIAIGWSALYTATTSSNNVAIGADAMYANTTGASNVAIGKGSLDANTTGAENVAVGQAALGANTTASYNTAVGSGALAANTTGYSNNAIGQGVLGANTTGAGNTAVGGYITSVRNAAMAANTTGYWNVAMGGGAFHTNTTGHSSVAIGFSAFGANTTAANGVAIGAYALDANTTGASNTGVGFSALGANTTGASNVAVGLNALAYNTTANQNTGVGVNALLTNTTGANNAAVGTGALGNQTTGANNAAVGMNSLHYSTTGAQNCALGMSAGGNITTGAYNVYIGYNAQPSAVGVDHELVIASANGVGKGGSTGYINPGGGAMYQGNNGTAWTQTSDRRIKKDIVPNTKGLAAINQIEPKNFYYKSDEELQEELPGAKEYLPLNKLTTSAIAQELDPIFPEAIERRGEHDIMSVNTDPIFWSMINAIKELSAKVTELEEKLNV